MRGIFSLVAFICILAAFVLGASFVLTSPLPHIADTFFTEIAEGNFEEARKLTDEKYQSTYDAIGIQETYKSPLFSAYSRGTWKRRTIPMVWPPKGFLEGEIDVGVALLPVRMTFSRTKERWAIEKIEVLHVEKSEKLLPAEADAIQLMNGVMTEFAVAVRSSDFQKFYDTLSIEWRTQTTPQDLQKNYVSVTSIGFDMGGLIVTKPTLTKQPRLNAEGDLELQGAYALPDGLLSTSLVFTREGELWKLKGMRLKVGG